MEMSADEEDAWLAYFQILQEMADEVGLDDEEDGIMGLTTNGGTEGT